MAYSTIPKGSNFFNTILYTGTGSSQVLTGVGFESTFNWIKRRENAGEYRMINQVRGGDYSLGSGTNDPELSMTDAISAWSSDGFTVGNAQTMASPYTYVAWNWKGNGQGSSNTDGSINTAYTSASTTSGFSVSTYTGTGANATVGHGLGVVPKMVIVKNMSTYTNWPIYVPMLNDSWKYLQLNSTAAPQTDNTVWNIPPTSSVFSVGTNSLTNGSGNSMIAFSFAEIRGYSQISEYVGNGVSDGVFVYTGFRPSWLMIKRTDDTGSWSVVDVKRDTYNSAIKRLNVDNAANTENTSLNPYVDILSNGFKLKTSSNAFNGSGGTYIYMAFAENPIVATSGSNAIPVTAR